MFPAQQVKHTSTVLGIFFLVSSKVSVKDCPERRAGKKIGERRAAEVFKDQRES